MASGLRTTGLFYYGRKYALKLPSVRDTSVSDLWLIGTGPYEDTLCRLDGGIDHNNDQKNFS